MSGRVSLRALVGALGVTTDSKRGFLEPASGRVVLGDESVTVGSGWVPLPDRYAIDERGMMRDFAEARVPAAAEALLDALHGGSGARQFRRALALLDLQQQWEAFRERRLTALARGFLEAHGIPCDEADRG